MFLTRFTGLNALPSPVLSRGLHYQLQLRHPSPPLTYEHWYLHKCRITTLTQHALTPLTLPSPLTRARGELAIEVR
jgi:hypothetical protein